MEKLAFLPFSLGSGFVAGTIAKKLFARVWALIDDQDVPQPEHRDVPMAKLALALVLEGALFSLIKGLVDHGARQGFAQLSGSWPGDERPESD